MKLSIIVPVFHEEKNIIQVIKRINHDVDTSHEILIIYDSVLDPTYIVLKDYLQKNPKSIRLLQSDQGSKKGVMNAIKTGFVHAKGNACVVLMADLSDDITQIDTMYHLFEKGWDIVCASRYMKGGKKIGGPFIKTFLSRIAGLTLHYLFRIPTMDSTNAFKLYNRKIFDVITLESTGGFEYSLEIILKAHKKGYKITEIPTVWKDREEGTSNFKMLAWLPQYAKWYFYSFSLPFFKKIFSSNVGLVLISMVVIVLKLNDIGLALRDKIVISSSLDFSWQVDTVQRLLHGYILGKDFVFTYGPLFQFLISLPSLLLHVPSYLSVALFPATGMVITGILLTIVVRLLLPKDSEQVILFAYLLFVIGIASLEQLIAIRILLPMVYALIWTKYLIFDKPTLKKHIGIALLPSIFGLFTYDLFLSCLFITILLAFGFVLYSKDKKQKLKSFSLSIVLILMAQLLTSLLLTNNGDYIQYAVTTLHDYYYVMNIPWQYDRDNILFIFPCILLLLIPYIITIKNLSNHLKILLIVLTIASLLEIKSAFIRPDAGHIIKAVYPSIIMVFLVLYFVARNKKGLIMLGILLYMLIPYKPVYYNTLAPKNIINLLHIIQTKPSFFSLYKMPPGYYYSEQDFKTFSYLTSANRNNIWIYPYDNYIANIQNSTYNSFALQLYDYSNSSIEQQTVTRLGQNPPGYIIFGIDTKGALNLDDIPNLTRNPLVFAWILKNYSVMQTKPHYLILKYNPEKKTAVDNTSCNLYKLVVDLTPVNPFEKIFSSFVKPSIYLTGDHKLRLPYTSSANSYSIFTGYRDSKKLQQLFENSINWNNTKETNQQVGINKQNPFTHHITLLDSSKLNTAVICLN